MNRFVLFCSLLVNHCSSPSAWANVPGKSAQIDLGTLSLESGIRHPSTEVIENSEILKKVASEILAREFQKIEKTVLQTCEQEEEDLR